MMMPERWLRAINESAADSLLEAIEKKSLPFTD